MSAAALGCKLRDLRLYSCQPEPDSVLPALERLIRGGVLESLAIDYEYDYAPNRPLLHEARAAMNLADALAASRSLTRLQLGTVHFWDDAAAAAAVMRALTGHASLQLLDLNMNTPPDVPTIAAAGIALGALVAADTPALTTLKVWGSTLGDAGLGPLFDALPCNNYLRELDCTMTGMSAAFARQVVLPAVRTNTSLRNLEASAFWEDEPDGRKAKAPPELIEAEALVAARNEQ